MSDRLIDVRVDEYSPHFVHAADRIWTETNCYVDLWVEVLHSLGHDPVPAAACAFSARFDGAQWTFLKFRPEDLLALYGVDVAEMNVWRRPVDHLEDNAAAARVDAAWIAAVGFEAIAPDERAALARALGRAAEAGRKRRGADT